MKKIVFFIVIALIALSCFDKKDGADNHNSENITPYLPFTILALDEASSFKELPENWKSVGGVSIDRTNEKTFVTTAGSGIVVNVPDDKNKEHLFTAFEHGDIEIELDVMMPKESNSGLYFQGRYEIQLLDSWGVKEPDHLDMGGIYQRWDDARGVGNEGFDGVAPLVNAAKAPGLWQHFRIIFHAPKFDGKGNKIENAKFEEVWLNGVLIQKNIEATGPTRASAYDDEQAKGPLMIQGDHGPMAFKNFKYKLYTAEKVRLTDMSLTEYQSDSVMLVPLDSLTPLREVKVDSMAATMASGENPQKILRFSGNMVLPESGEYLFDYRIHENGGILIINKDTVVNRDGDFKLDSPGIGRKQLKAGKVPFQLIYNKHRYWKQGFSLYVEGPGIQKQALHAPSSLDRTGFGLKGLIMLDVATEVVLQRSFWMHEGEKRTHCISVGTPQGIHYAYDLDNASLLQVWDGRFFDASELWLNRAEKQLGMPAGFTVTFHGDPQFSNVLKDNEEWPVDTSNQKDFKVEGYTIDAEGLPTFMFKKGATQIKDFLKPSSDMRALERSIKFDGSTGLAHKLAEGNKIEVLPDGRYIVNDESYFIKFTEVGDLKPEIRRSNGKEELIVNVPSGAHKLNYTIIW